MGDEKGKVLDISEAISRKNFSSIMEKGRANQLYLRERTVRMSIETQIGDRQSLGVIVDNLSDQSCKVYVQKKALELIDNWFKETKANRIEGK